MTETNGPSSFEERPWGKFWKYFDNGRVWIKRLIINPGQRISLQRHEGREEYWIITKGSPKFQLGDDEFKTVDILEAGATVHIYYEEWHRIEAPPDEEVELIEIAKSDFGELDEEDIERKEDDYGRTD